MDEEQIVARLDSLESLIRGRLGPVTDPAPDDVVRWRWPLPDFWRDWRPTPVPIPNPGDPSPIDFGRFSKIQLQLVQHHIQAERVRLDAMESLLKEQIASLERG